jgi:hypothetical protein
MTDQPKIIKPEDIKGARRVMRLAFEQDGGNVAGSLMSTWIANMAFLLFDRHGVPIKLAEKQSEDLLNIMFEEAP